MRLSDLLSGYYSVSIIGMCKNAGKTTVLNKIISEMNHSDIRPAITSIGRDGESSDVVTGTEKPGIYIREGTIVATALDMLRYCDVTKEILDATGISTPLGEVIIFRALSDGNVQIAGPSLVDQLAVIRERFRNFGAEKVLIDGALSRKSLCSHNLSDATILCSGASFNKDIDIVADETGYVCKILTLPVLSESENAYRLMQNAEKDCLIISDDGQSAVCAPGNIDAVIKENKQHITHVYFTGAITDAVLKPVVMSGNNLEGITFTAFDGSKFLLSKYIFDKINLKKGAFAVLKGVNPVAVAVNPFSAYGLHFDKNEFYDKVRAQVSLPVFNVEDM